MFSMYPCDSLSADMQIFAPGTGCPTCHAASRGRNEETFSECRNVDVAEPSSGCERVPRRVHIYQEQGPVNVDKEIRDLNVSGEDRQARGSCHRRSG